MFGFTFMRNAILSSHAGTLRVMKRLCFVYVVIITVIVN